jgi:hypothetical protein
MNWILSLVVVYFLFMGDPPLIDVLHEYLMNYLLEKEKVRV